MRSKRNYTGAAVLSIDNMRGRKRIICAITVAAIFTVCTLCGSILSSAHEGRVDSPVNLKQYTSIEIQPGDTLWDIAERYITVDYKSVPEYVQALKDMNSLKTDNIEAGQNLMVAYNDIL